MTPYDELLSFVERESGLIRAGAWEELVAADAERRALVALLPQSPSPDALGLLERMLGLLERNAAAIAAAMAQTRGELDRIVRSRRTLRSYAAAPPPRHDFVG